MIGVDVGGTFTDVVSVEDGKINTVKIATNVKDPELAVLDGAHAAGVSHSAVFNHASTHGLNAIITRNLPKIGFLTTEGHRDLLDMGRTWRPREGLMNPAWRRSYGDAARPLVRRYLRRGVRERITADGSVLSNLDETHAREQLATLRRCEVHGIAVCLINAYINNDHEQRLREIVREELGDIPCSISSEVAPLSKEFARASTTVVDVFMKLIYRDYTARLDHGLRNLGFSGDLNFADCAAQLVRAQSAMKHPFRVVFAGPAAGTVSSAHLGRMLGKRDLLCCDVGGTSCDISMVKDGDPFVNTTFELEHDLIVNALSNEVSSIGAGGGSVITSTSTGELKVGPASAGPNPGPACYGLGGTDPTITDACLLMGLLEPSAFAGGQMRLDYDRSVSAFENLSSPLGFGQRVSYGFHVGVNNVAEGVTDIALSHGVDPRDYSLIAYGAAGPMLLPAVLDIVKAEEVIVPPHPGHFSALGLVSSDLVYADSRSAYTILSEDAAPVVDAVYTAMETQLAEQVRPDDRENLEFRRSFDGHLVGQTWETPFIEVPTGKITAKSISEMIEGFHREYKERTGNRFDSLPVQGVTYRVQAVVSSDKVDYPKLSERTSNDRLQPVGVEVIKHFADSSIDAAVYRRSDLMAADTIEGPAIVREPVSTTFILPDQKAVVGERGEIIITNSR